MNREELIQALHNAWAAENASAVCIDNIISTLDWTGLPEEEQATVAGILEKLSAAAQKRAGELEACLHEIERSPADVF